MRLSKSDILSIAGTLLVMLLWALLIFGSQEAATAQHKPRKARILLYKTDTTVHLMDTNTFDEIVINRRY